MATALEKLIGANTTADASTLGGAANPIPKSPSTTPTATPTAIARPAAVVPKFISPFSAPRPTIQSTQQAAIRSILQAQAARRAGIEQRLNDYAPRPGQGAAAAQRFQTFQNAQVAQTHQGVRQVAQGQLGQFMNDIRVAAGGNGNPQDLWNHLDVATQYALLQKYPYLAAADPQLAQLIMDTNTAYRQYEAQLQALQDKRNKKGFFQHGIGNVLGAPLRLATRDLLGGVAKLANLPGKGIDKAMGSLGLDPHQWILDPSHTNPHELYREIVQHGAPVNAANFLSMLTPEQRDYFFKHFANTDGGYDPRNITAGHKQTATPEYNIPNASRTANWDDPAERAFIIQRLNNDLRSSTQALKAFVQVVGDNTDLSQAAAAAANVHLFSTSFVGSLVNDPGQLASNFIPTGILGKAGEVATKLTGVEAFASIGRLDSLGKVQHWLKATNGQGLKPLVEDIASHAGDVNYITKTLKKMDRGVQPSFVEGVIKASEKGSKAGIELAIRGTKGAEKLGVEFRPASHALGLGLKMGGKFARAADKLAGAEGSSVLARMSRKFGVTEQKLRALSQPSKTTLKQIEEHVTNEDRLAKGTRLLGEKQAGLGVTGALRGTVNDALVAVRRSGSKEVAGIAERTKGGVLSLSKSATGRLDKAPGTTIVGHGMVLPRGVTLTKAHLNDVISRTGAYAAFGAKAFDVAKAEAAAVAAGVKVRPSTLARLGQLPLDVRHALALSAARDAARPIEELAQKALPERALLTRIDRLKGANLRAALGKLSTTSRVPVTKDFLYKSALPKSELKHGLALGETWKMRAENFVQQQERHSFETELLSRTNDPRALAIKALEGRLHNIDSSLTTLARGRAAAEKMIQNSSKTVTRQEFERIRQPLVGKAFSGVRRFYEDLHMTAPPQAVALHGAFDRAHQLSEFGHALGISKDVLDGVANRAFHLEEGDAAGVHNLIKEVIGHAAEKAGVDAKVLQQVWRDKTIQFIKEAKPGYYDTLGAREAKVFSQLDNYVALPSFWDVKKTIADLRMKTAKGLRRGTETAKLIEKKPGLLYKAQNIWKFSIIAAPAYLGAAAAGLVAGAVGAAKGALKGVGDTAVDYFKTPSGERSLGGSFRRGLAKDVKRGYKQFSAVGMGVGATLGGLHYIIKIPLLDEGVLRPALTHGVSGFTGRASFGIGRSMMEMDDARLAELGITREEYRVMSQRMIDSARGSVEMNVTEDYGKARGIMMSKGERGTIGRDDPTFNDQWGHALNRQIADDDPVVSALLPHRFGTDMERASAETKAAKWLDGDPVGMHWRDRYLQQHPSFKNSDDIVKNSRSFLDQIVTTPRIRDERLGGMVSKDALREARRNGLAPEAIHGIHQDYLSLTSMRNLKNATSRFVFDNPHNVQRIAYMEHEYYGEFNKLLDQGVDIKRAADIAAHRAVQTTNDTFLRIDKHSLFAKRADLFSPFIGVKMQNLVKLPRVLFRYPLRTMKVEHVVAAAFNEGKSIGMFKKDPYGNWVMVVPGSAALSRWFGAGDHPFEFGLSSMFAYTDGAYNIGVIPSVGGALTGFGTIPKMLQNSHPHIFDSLPKSVQYMLFPYGNTGNVDNSAVRSLGQWLFHGTAPWDFASKRDQQEQLKKNAFTAYSGLYDEYVKAHGVAPDAAADVQLKQQAQQMVRAQLLMKGLWSVFWPAGITPVSPTRDDYYKTRDAYKFPTGGYNYSALLAAHPEFQAYVSANSARTWVGPQNDWLQPGSYNYADLTQSQKAALNSGEDWYSLDTFTKELEAGQQNAQLTAEWNRITANQDYGVYRVEQDQFLKDHPEYAALLQSKHQVSRDYWRIRNIADPTLQAKALQDWRYRGYIDPATGQKVTISASYERTLRTQFDLGELTPNPWTEARNVGDLWASYIASRNRLSGPNSLKAQKYSIGQFIKDNHLTAAEAYKLYQFAEMNYTPGVGEPWKVTQATVAAFAKARGKISDANPHLFNRPVDPFTAYRTAQLQKQYGLKTQDELYKMWNEQSGPMYTKLDHLKATQKEAVKAKNWSLVKQLSGAIREEHLHITALRNSLYSKYPDINKLQDVVKEGIWGNITPAVIDRIKKLPNGDGYIVVDPEERQYLRWNGEVRQAYLDNLKTEVSQFLHWNWLSDFQQKILQQNFPLQQIERWRSMTAEDYKMLAKKHFGSGSHTNSTDPMGYVRMLMNKYNKRGNMAKPAAYAEYLKIDRKNSALRVAFLDAHPDVAAYIKAGPLANMPPLYRNIVTNIMISVGKWQGTEMSPQEVTDLSWAESQLQKYSHRQGMTKPSTLDLWLKMPTGPAKAAYIQAHPEISRWLSAGPMANMPPAQKEVVRDIMKAYGQWTESQDPLSRLLGEYSQVPPSQKQAFLAAHPEIIQYWRALRPPSQRAQFDLAQTYFGITDSTAKHAFLQAHPELQDYFVEERQRRYEQFLQQVGFFFQSNPEMIQGYLKEQTTIMEQLFQKYGSRPLTLERVFSRPVQAKSRHNAA